LLFSSGGVDDSAVFAWQSSDPSIVSVSTGGVATGLKVGVASITATSGGITGSVSVGVVSASTGAASLTLSGNATYEDRNYDLSGFTGTLTEKPIRNVVVELVAIDGFQVIATSSTDALGDFNISADNSARRGGVYLRVVSRTDSANTEKVEVRNNSTQKSLLAFVSAGIDDSVSEPFSTTQDMLATVSSRIGGAFNIIDVMSDASALVQTLGTCPAPNTDCVPPLATVYWEPNSSAGTFYDDVADAISVLGGGVVGGDTDEYDDVILVHEYAHFILSKFARDDSPGGQHDVFDSAQDIRLSWSEGWATFFAYAVLNSPLYVDTAAGGTLISFNNENYSGPSKSGTPLSAFAIYTTNEVSVSGVLWDVIDAVDAGEVDPLDLNFSDVFETVLDFPSLKPTTLATFWTTFFNAPLTAGSSSGFQTILQRRQISLFEDAGESGESLLTTSASQTHTLYQGGADPAGDTDVISFSANMGTAYTVRTFNLSDGADTLLTIRGPSSELVGSNDNTSGSNHANCGISIISGTSSCPSNNASNLASTVSFTAQTNGTFTAEVTHSSTSPPSAGLLGKYEIGLSSP